MVWREYAKGLEVFKELISSMACSLAGSMNHSIRTNAYTGTAHHWDLLLSKDFGLHQSCTVDNEMLTEIGNWINNKNSWKFWIDWRGPL